MFWIIFLSIYFICGILAAGIVISCLQNEMPQFMNTKKEYYIHLTIASGYILSGPISLIAALATPCKCSNKIHKIQFKLTKY